MFSLLPVQTASVSILVHKILVSASMYDYKSENDVKYEQLTRYIYLNHSVSNWDNHTPKWEWQSFDDNNLPRVFNRLYLYRSNMR